MKKKTVFGDQTAKPKSKMHQKVVGLLKDAYEGFTILEEEAIEVRVDGRVTKLFVDILVKDLKLCIECHGIQHFEYTPHFHKSKADLEKQQRLDKAKEEAIVGAGFTLLVVRHDEWEKMTLAQLIKKATKALRETR